MQPVYDPKAAKKLLEDESWIDSDSDGILDKIIQGKRVPFEFTFLAPGNAPFALIIIEDLRKVGIKAHLQILDFATVLQNIRVKNYDAYFAKWVGEPIEPDLFDKYHSGENPFGYANHSADSLLEAIRAEPDRDNRLSMLQKLQHIIVDDPPETYMFPLGKSCLA